MNNNLPIIKVYNIDFSFILKNYLNPEMWTKKWTLFQYKEFVFTLNIDSINCANEKIVFRLTLEDILHPKDYEFESDWLIDPQKTTRIIDYSLKIDDIKFLKRKIYSHMIFAITDLEIRKCRATTEYKEIKNAKQYEKETLRHIAEEFLDENNVTNEDIREVYIENYIDNNSEIDNKLYEYVKSKSYKLLTELYLVVAESQQDKDLIDDILAEDEEYENIYEEVKEYMVQLETEEYKDELAKNLEVI